MGDERDAVGITDDASESRREGEVERDRLPLNILLSVGMLLDRERERVRDRGRRSSPSTVRQNTSEART